MKKRKNSHSSSHSSHPTSQNPSGTHIGAAKGTNTLKKRAIFTFKLVFVFGLLYFLVKKGFISVEATQDALKQWNKIIPALCVFLINTGLGAIRWHWLLEAQGIQLRWTRSFQLTFIGNFFNIALPGAVSGDFVKAFYTGKEIKGNRAKAFGSILFDRVAGVSALVLVSAGTLAFGYRSYAGTQMFRAIQVLIEIAASCVIFFFGYLFLVREHHDPLLKLFRSTEKIVPQLSSLTKIYESLRHYHHCRWAVIKALLISVVVHLAGGWAALQFAQALGESHLSLVPIWVVFPLGLLVTAIPVAPAGVGTGNIAFLYFFHLIGSERGADIFSLVALSNILMGALGGLVYFRFRSQEELPPITLQSENPA